MKAKDLTQEAPRSPRLRIRDYAILGRTLDKCRAVLAGKGGEYHFNCPLDNMLFGFKGVDGNDFKARVQEGASDDEMGIWLDQHGVPMKAEEIREWSDKVEASSMYDVPEKREWFVGECERLGLDPKKASLFDMLEADDAQSFHHQAA